MSTFHQLWSNKDKKQLGVHLFGLIHVPIIFAKQHHFWLKAPFPWPHLNLHAEIHIILVKISLLLVDNCFTGKIPIVWFDSQSFLLESRCANCLTTSFSGWITIFARQIDMFLVYPMSSPHDSWQKPFHSNISIISISRHGAAMVRPSHWLLRMMMMMDDDDDDDDDDDADADDDANDDGMVTCWTGVGRLLNLVSTWKEKQDCNVVTLW